MDNQPYFRRDHPTAVICYLIDGALAPRDKVHAAIGRLAEIVSNGLVLRVGYRAGPREGTYWVFLNDRNIARAYLEPYFRSVAKKQGAESVVLARKFALPPESGDTNPRIQPVLKRLVQQEEPRLVEQPPAPPQQPAPDTPPKAPAEPPKRRGPGFSDEFSEAGAQLKGKLIGGITERLRGATRRRRKPKKDGES